jgi:pimeloyl-ACP methyl ester carboxylesterase
MVGRILFNTIRDINVIDKYLDVAYVNRQAFDGSFDDSFDGWGAQNGNAGISLNQKIRACTEGKGGHAAFASILWSPPASSTHPDGESTSSSPTIGFYDALQQLPIDVLLLFGSNDEWCTPAVAKRMHTTLHDRPSCVISGGPAPTERYITIDNVGHCPNHEAPTAVSKVLLSWLEASSSQSRADIPLVSDVEASVIEPWGKVLLREVSIQESNNLGFVDRMISSVVG